MTLPLVPRKAILTAGSAVYPSLPLLCKAILTAGSAVCPSLPLLCN